MNKYRCEINTNYKWSDLYCFNVRFYHVLKELKVNDMIGRNKKYLENQTG